MERWRAGKPIVAGGVTVVLVERLFLESYDGNGAGWLHGSLEPRAVVVRDAAGVRAFDTKARSIPVESLVQKIPELGALLGSSPFNLP